MSEPSKYQSYSASDIGRYHAGKMTPAEMHALEKAALDDPFLADALEGYTHTPTAAADLAALTRRLNEKTRSRRTPVLTGSFRWMSIAALFLILAGAGWFLFRTTKPMTGEDKNDLAYKTSSPSVPPVTSSADTMASTNNSDSTRSYVEDRRNSNRNQALRGEEQARKATPTPETENYATVEKAEGNFGTDSVARERFFAMDQELVVQKPETKFKDNTALNTRSYRKEPGRKQAAGPATNNVSNNLSVANASNNWRTARDSVKIADARSEMHPAYNMDLRKDSALQLNVVLVPLPEDSNLAEIMVTSPTAKKNAAAKPIIIIDTLEPAEGRTYFDEYVTAHLKTPAELKEKPVSGEVRLSFDVDQNGLPVNIAVEKSLTPKLDEEAIRILREGPKWKKKKNRKGRVTFRF
jgi:TonB family protein